MIRMTPWSALPLICIGLLAAPAFAAAPMQACEITVCTNGVVRCADTWLDDNETTEGSAAGGVECKMILASMPCSEVEECPRGTPAMAGTGLALLTAGLAAAGLFVARRQRHRA